MPVRTELTDDSFKFLADFGTFNIYQSRSNFNCFTTKSLINDRPTKIRIAVLSEDQTNSILDSIKEFNNSSCRSNNILIKDFIIDQIIYTEVAAYTTA